MDIVKLNRFYNCNPEDCWDENVRKDICSQRVADGHCLTDTSWMLTNCKKSCQFCDFLGEPKAQKDINCQDLAEPNICIHNYDEGNCHNNEYGDYFKINCRRSCEFCTPCFDFYPECPERLAQGQCDRDDVKALCRRSCNLCEPPSSNSTA